jgi:hypothetical protein
VGGDDTQATGPMVSTCILHNAWGRSATPSFIEIELPLTQK